MRLWTSDCRRPNPRAQNPYIYRGLGLGYYTLGIYGEELKRKVCLTDNALFESRAWRR